MWPLNIVLSFFSCRSLFTSHHQTDLISTLSTRSDHQGRAVQRETSPNTEQSTTDMVVTSKPPLRISQHWFGHAMSEITIFSRPNCLTTTWRPAHRHPWQAVIKVAHNGGHYQWSHSDYLSTCAQGLIPCLLHSRYMLTPVVLVTIKWSLLQ